jgi:hypothetical protein
MKKVFNVLIFALFVGLMSACSLGEYGSNTVRTMNLTPDVVWIDMSLKDFEFLGEVKVDIKYRTYMEVFKVYDAINGEAYNRRMIRSVRFAGDKGVALSPAIQKATYKVIDKFPNADYYVPVSTDKRVEKMFMGRNTEEVVTFKVYKQRN